jgi:H+/Na+-translocating ferredoxin:NAD+ oxidoreductase subunit D
MRLEIACSPHLRLPLKTSRVMLEVIAALIPATVAAIFFFGMPAVFLITNCVVSAVLAEYLVLKMRKKTSTLKDYSAALTGLLLALILPPTTKWYAATLGSVFAIVVAKQIFGGLGSNIFNPALIGRAFLMAAYPKMLTTYIAPRGLDAISSATPLMLRKFSHEITPTIDLFIGSVSGSLGETSALFLIIGGAYLLVRKIADWRIPLTMLVLISAISFACYKINPINGSTFFHIFSGGLLLGVFFMATDPATTPVTKLGRYIFGIGCAIVIMILRYFSGLPEGVMYSILFMNAFTPLINRYTIPKPFGR